jgi:hypothetical protein
VNAVLSIKIASTCASSFARSSKAFTVQQFNRSTILIWLPFCRLCPSLLPASWALALLFLIRPTPAVASAATTTPVLPCRIQVIEKGTGWPVPLVELRTTHQVRFVTDNNGVVAFDLPELMGKETWFDVKGNGYEVPKDGFGNRGVRLLPEPGQRLSFEVARTILARRLGRITGSGLFAESQKLGEDLDWKDNDVLGCDSIQNAIHAGRLFWLWGDTTLARYPLGIFDSTSAATSLHPITDFKPPIRLKLDYFCDEKGKPRGVAKMPGAGPTWITAYVSLPDRNGAEKLVATYLKVRDHMQVYERGLCVWNDRASSFEKLRTVWSLDASKEQKSEVPEGHPVFWTDQDRKRWLMFGNPFPVWRCPATFEAWQDESSWETLKPQKGLDSARGGTSVKPHSGSIAWHPWKKKWVTIFMESFGKPSAFGELWYAEADAPTGLWGKAVKVLSHENYTFYNPRIHSEWFNPKSPALIFEGTYTTQFANKPEPTARYDYNQILYRLDLDDQRLN